ncbi:MAG: ABC transporter permease [Clostridia bacterium]|nr:ABC transporter permease [Clostridia bacterium]
MLFKLAFRNVKRQIGNYLIYFITVSLTVALIFSINNMIFSDVIRLTAESLGSAFETSTRALLFMLSGFLSVVIAFVLGYATSFLLSRRKKEFGLYLTMGMTRGNIVTIFAGETAVNFLLSLGMGIFLGMGFFQAIVAVFSDFLLMDYVFNGYSLSGTLITVILVCAIFLLSSVFSMLYLGIAKISHLLQGEKSVEKTVKNPAKWFVVAIVSLAILIVSVTLICILLFGENVGGNAGLICGMGALSALAILVFYLSLTKCIIPLLLKRKQFASRGTNTFTLRLISGRLSANSFMTGIIALLLSLAVIGTNIFSTQVAAQVESYRQHHAYDCLLSHQGYTLEQTDIAQMISQLEKHSDVKEYCHYFVYESEERTLNPLVNPMYADEDKFIKESDYRKLCAMLGRRAMDLNGGFLVIPCDLYTYWNGFPAQNFSNATLQLNGVTYPCTGVVEVQENMANVYMGQVIAVVPDEAISQELSIIQTTFAANFKLFAFDRERVSQTLMEFSGDYGFSNFYVKEDVPSYVFSTGAPIFLILLFVSAVLALLSMAVLALKSMSMISEDKAKYKILWRLGADKKTVGKTLFFQLFFFFFAPLAMPVLLNVPLGFICTGMAALIQGKGITLSIIVGELAKVTGALLALYALYFVVTYLLALLDVKRSVHSAE